MLMTREDHPGITDDTDPGQTDVTESEAPQQQRVNAAASTRGLSFSQVATIVRRRSRAIFAVAGAGTILAAGIGLLIPPQYTATALLSVEFSGAGRDQASLSTPALEQSIDTHVTLIRSQAHLQRIIDSFSGNGNPAPTTKQTAGEQATREQTTRDQATREHVSHDDNAAITKSGTNIGLVDQEAADRSSIGELINRISVWTDALHTKGKATETVDALQRHVRVMQERRSRVISVSFTSTSPQIAAAFANRIAELYIQDLSTQKQADTRAQLSMLDQRIAESKREMTATAASLETAGEKDLGSGRSAEPGQRDDSEQLRELARQAALTAQAYKNLEIRKQRMQEDQNGFVPGVAITSLASIPNRPSSLNPLLFIFPAFAIFVIGGCWFAVVLDQLDRGMRNQDDTSAALGIPCLECVPRLSRQDASRSHQELLADPRSAYGEAIRSIVVTLHLTESTRRHQVVLLTSSHSGEGKTMLAASLATYVAMLGQRVVVLDLEVRRRSPDAGREIASDNIEPDSELDQRPLSELIRHGGDLGVDYLAMPRCTTDPVLLFQQERIPTLVAQLREAYDCVIIDGPPILTATEARLLPSLSDKVLFVVKWGETSREAAQNALDILRNNGWLQKRKSSIASRAKSSSLVATPVRPVRSRKQRKDVVTPIGILTQVNANNATRSRPT
jgi:polysaccharide biosynthesis transport protein